jgi:transposase
VIWFAPVRTPAAICCGPATGSRSCCLRHGAVYDATAWTRAHDVWLRRQRFPGGPLAIVFDECYGRVLDAKTRRDALDEAIVELAATPPYVDVVGRLVCLRGLSTLTAFALTVELGDWRRFRPESLGPFLGLTPSENSSGGAAPPRRDHQDRQHLRAPAPLLRPPGTNAARNG